MGNERIETGKAPDLLISCGGDLRVRGWAEAAVLVKGEEFTTAEGEQGLAIEARGDLSLMVPALTKLQIEAANRDLSIRNIDGDVLISDAKRDVMMRNLGAVDVGVVHADLQVRNLSGDLVIKEVMGDASLRNTQNVTIDSVYGDLTAAFVNGSASLQEVMGDVNLKTVNEDVQISKGHRDANLRNLGGHSNSADVRGDIRLRGGLSSGKHNFTASGDIIVRWPGDAPMNIEARAPAIRNRLSLEKVIEEEGYLSGSLGDGETTLIVEAKGRIILKELRPTSDPWQEQPSDEFQLDMDFTSLGEQIANEVNSRMSEWSSRMEKEFGPELSAKIERRFQDTAAKAERAAEKAARKAERAAKRARWKAGYDGWSGPTSGTAATARSTERKKATEEEQLKILRMVEQGIISPDEASTLLDAIES